MTPRLFGQRSGASAAQPVTERDVLWGVPRRPGYDPVFDPAPHRRITKHAFLASDDLRALCGYRPSRWRTRGPVRLAAATDANPGCGRCSAALMPIETDAALPAALTAYLAAIEEAEATKAAARSRVRNAPWPEPLTAPRRTPRQRSRVRKPALGDLPSVTAIKPKRQIPWDKTAPRRARKPRPSVSGIPPTQSTAMRALALDEARADTKTAKARGKAGAAANRGASERSRAARPERKRGTSSEGATATPSIVAPKPFPNEAEVVAATVAMPAGERPPRKRVRRRSWAALMMDAVLVSLRPDRMKAPRDG